MAVHAMNHFTILAEDLETTRRFYSEVIGLREGYRPPLELPGAWFYAGDQAVLHVMAGMKMPEPRAGVLDHMAFSATGLAETVKQLQGRGIEYRLMQQPGSRVWQIFFHDPNGAKVELDFAPEEQPPAS